MKSQEHQLNTANEAVNQAQLYRINDLTVLLNVSKSKIWAATAKGEFPPAIRIFNRVTAWRKTDIEAWLAAAGTGVKLKVAAKKVGT